MSQVNNTTTNPGSGGDTITTVDTASFAAFPSTGKIPVGTIYASVDTSTVPTPCVKANPLYVKATDGTNVIAITTSSAAVAENTSTWLKTVSAMYGYDGSASAGSKSVPLTVVSTASPLLKVSHFNSTNQMPAGDNVARPIFVKPGDGTSSVSLKAANAAIDETATTFMETASALFAIDAAASATAKQVPLNVVSTAAPWLKVALFNSTNQMPAGDAAARSLFVEPNDGTNKFLSGAVANIAAGVGTNSMLVVKPGEWTVTNTSVANAQATVQKAAPAGSGKLVITSITVSLAAGAAVQTPITASVIQDSGGSAVTLWAATLGAAANSAFAVSATCHIVQTVANKTLDIQFSAAGTTNTIQSVTMSGYTLA